MKRFFLIPLLTLAILAAGCTCTMRGSATVPTKAPSAAPTMKATMSPTTNPTMSPTANPTMESVAPVAPTPEASSSPNATNGN